MYKLFIIMILGSILQCLYNIFITDRISRDCAEKAKYNCDKCENWKCYKKYCDNKKLKK